VSEEVLQAPLHEICARAGLDFLGDVRESYDDVRDYAGSVQERPRDGTQEDPLAVGTMQDDVVDGDVGLFAERPREREPIFRIRRPSTVWMAYDSA